MGSVTAILGPLLIDWLILFVACYIVTEFGQDYLYDGSTPYLGLKVLLGSLLLAALLTWTRTRFDTMATSELPRTVLQAIVWFAVFTLIFRFHPPHGAAFGVLTMLVVAGLATLAVDSLAHSSRGVRTELRRPSKPVRHPAMPNPQPVPGPTAPASK